jgi:hypothetical protein
LEIGIDAGDNFNAIRCAEKTGVDPANFANIQNVVECASDDFFSGNKRRFDLIFIDGLHHADVVGRDLRNALNCLHPGGAIVCHDLLPSDERMQMVPRETGLWTGDCWKAWVKLRAARPELSMFVAEMDYGVGLIFPEGGFKPPRIEIEEASLTWERFSQMKAEWLPLVPPSMISELAAA